MAGLFEKDIRILLQRKQTLVLFLALAILLGFTQEGPFILAYFTFLILILATGTISYDELDGGFTFLFTLPIDIKTYVREKYIFCGCAGVLAWAFAVVIYGSAAFVNGRKIDIAEEFPMLCAFLVLVALLTAFTIPVLIRFGANGMNAVMLVVGGIILLLFFAVKQLVGDTQILRFSMVASDLLDQYYGIIFVGVGLGALLISYLYSLRAMRMRLMEGKVGLGKHASA